MARKLNRTKLTFVEYGNGISSATPAVKGMFFFAGTGPAWATCNLCKAALDATPRDINGKEKGALKVRCQKTKDYQGHFGAAYPPESCACKYFERRDKPLLTTAFDKFNGAK